MAGDDASNPLLVHGAPRVDGSGRRLCHDDGTPFFWLADTWWSAMTARFRWPDVFQTVAADRAAKGFTVIQLVAGLVPEFEPFSEKMASEGGQPWLEEGKGPINPAYWDVPDQKIDHLVELGIVPCIVGGWAYFHQFLGAEGVRRHLRYVVARYGAYPVVWCIAGEVDLRNLHDEQEFTMIGEVPTKQVKAWEDGSNYVRQIDPFHRVRTAHPCPVFTFASSEVFRSRDSFDLDMLQSGHTGLNCVPATMTHLRTALAAGDKPVLNGECSYEGIFGSSWHDVQRFLFWSHVLQGTAGHTYGTMALSTFNSRVDPHVPLSHVSMHFWEDAIDWLGSAHLGAGKRILERLRWWELESAPANVEPHGNPDDWFLPYAAALADGTVIVYLPGLGVMGSGRTSPRADWPAELRTMTLRGLVPGPNRGTWVDPRTSDEHSSFDFEADEQGGYTLRSGRFGLLTPGPTGEDWVLILQSLRKDAA